MESLVDLYYEEISKSPVAFSQAVVGEVYRNKEKAFFKVHIGSNSWEKEFKDHSTAKMHREAFVKAVKRISEKR